MNFLVKAHYQVIKHWKQIQEPFYLIDKSGVYAKNLFLVKVLPYMTVFDDWDNSFLTIGFIIPSSKNRFKFVFELKLEKDNFKATKATIYEVTKTGFSTFDERKVLRPSGVISSKMIAEIVNETWKGDNKHGIREN